MKKKLPAKYVLITLCVLYALNFLDRSLLGILGEAIKQDMHLSDAQLGLVQSILLITLLFAIMPAAALNDVMGRRTMLTIAAALWTCAMLGTGAVTVFMGFVAVRLIASANDAFIGCGATSWLSQQYPVEQRGRVLGIFTLCSPLGMAAGTLWGGCMLALTDNWRLAFLPLIIPGLFCCLMLPRLPDSQPHTSARQYFTGLPAVLRRPTLLICGISCGAFDSVSYSYQAWGPSLLMRNYDVNSAVMGAGFAVVLFVGALGPLLGGRFADWWRARSAYGLPNALVLCMSLAALSKMSLYALVGVLPLETFSVVALFDGVTTRMTIPIFYCLVNDVVNDRYRNMASGFMGTMGFLFGGAWGPLAVGFLSDYFGGGAEGIRTAMLAMSGMGLVAVAAALSLRLTYASDRAHALSDDVSADA